MKKVCVFTIDVLLIEVCKFSIDTKQLIMIEKVLELRNKNLEIKFVSLPEFIKLLGGSEGTKRQLTEYEIPCELLPPNCLIVRVDCRGPQVATYDDYLRNEMLREGYTEEDFESAWKEIYKQVQSA